MFTCFKHNSILYIVLFLWRFIIQNNNVVATKYIIFTFRKYKISPNLNNSSLYFHFQSSPSPSPSYWTITSKIFSKLCSHGAARGPKDKTLFKRLSWKTVTHSVLKIRINSTAKFSLYNLSSELLFVCSLKCARFLFPLFFKTVISNDQSS